MSKAKKNMQLCKIQHTKPVSEELVKKTFILVAFHVKNGRLCKLTGLSFLKMSMGCSKIGLLAKSQPVLCGFAGYRPQGHPFLLQWAQRELMTIVMKDTLGTRD